VVGAHSYLAMNYLIHASTAFIKEKYLLPNVSGQLIGSLAMTSKTTLE
jgi:hypothetical protein